MPMHPSSSLGTFVSKPERVEAFHWEGRQEPSVHARLSAWLGQNWTQPDAVDLSAPPDSIAVFDGERWREVAAGAVIVRHLGGRISVIPVSTFLTTYEVED